MKALPSVKGNPNRDMTAQCRPYQLCPSESHYLAWLGTAERLRLCKYVFTSASTIAEKLPIALTDKALFASPSVGLEIETTYV